MGKENGDEAVSEEKSLEQLLEAFRADLYIRLTEMEARIQNSIDAMSASIQSMLQEKAERAASGQVTLNGDSDPLSELRGSDDLEVTDAGDRWIVKPKRYLGSARFSEVSRTVKALGGRYVSDGKNSRFEIKK